MKWDTQTQQTQLRRWNVLAMWELRHITTALNRVRYLLGVLPRLEACREWRAYPLKTGHNRVRLPINPQGM